MRLTDLQVRSMSDNLIIAETLNENMEEQVRAFFQKQLELKKEEAEEITFVRVHRMGKKRTFGEAAAPAISSPRPIIIKFNRFEHRQQIKYLGPKLKGKPFGISEQYPKAVMERRKVLLPLYYQERIKGNKVKLVVDRLYVNNKLFVDPKMTPWLTKSR